MDMHSSWQCGFLAAGGILVYFQDWDGDPICLAKTVLHLQDQHNSIAKFLEAKGMPDQALQVATDPGAAHWVSSRSRFVKWHACAMCAAAATCQPVPEMPGLHA